MYVIHHCLIRQSDKSAAKGVPDFWLTALQNNHFFDAAITEKDIEVLRFLEDVSFDYVTDEPWVGSYNVCGPFLLTNTNPKPPQSFVLTFRFAADNPFLESTVMKKTYHIKKQDDGETICETVDSYVLQWKLNLI